MRNTKRGNKLRFYMDRREMNYQALAKATGLSITSISQWANDQTEPSLMNMRKVATALICGVSDIWPHIREPVDWEFRHQLLTERIERMNYHEHPEEYEALCDERNWVSVKVYIAEQRTRLRNYRADDYCTDTAYGRMPSTGKVLTY